MNANNDAHVATLRGMMEQADSPAIDFHLVENERRAINAAIRALSADRGEAMTRRQVESVLAEVLDEADESLSIGAFDELVNRFAGATPPSSAEGVEPLELGEPDPVPEWAKRQAAAPSGVSDADRWYLGAMNDGLFIINRPPSPAGTDVGPWMNPNGPTVVLNVTDLPQEKAQAIVDAHNAQPQPGRVEGMETWFVSGSHGWPGGIEFRSRDQAISHIREHDGLLHFWIHQANRKDYTREEVAAMLAAAPTAGGDA